MNDRPRSVMHVVENLNMGGAERVVIDLVSEQQRRGMACQVVCLFERGNLAGELDQLAVPVMALNKQPGLDVSALRKLRRQLAQTRPQVIHTHNAMPHYYAVLASLGMSLTRINTRHGMGDFLGTPKQRLLYRLAMLATDRACGVCEAATRQFVASGLMAPGKAATVYNGLPLSRFSDRKPGALRGLLGLDSDCPLVVTVGRLNAAKDQRTLLEAFEQLASTRADVHLVLIGDGPERKSLREQAANLSHGKRIHFTGARSDVPALLRDASLFALSSITEGFSIALLEAGCAGLPVVATDVGGNGEIIASQERGLLVPASDAGALSTAMNALLSSPDRAAGYGQNLQQWVASHCSIAAMADAYARVYRGNGSAA